MKKVPVITLDEILAAERCIRAESIPQPEGTISAEQYANIRGIGLSSARNLLCQLHRRGVYTKEKWNRCYVYRLVRK